MWILCVLGMSLSGFLSSFLVRLTFFKCVCDERLIKHGMVSPYL